MGIVVGIDLGTTNSVIAITEGGVPRVIANSEGSALTPSVVSYTESQEILVGQSARNQAILHPERTVYSAKRLMGRRYETIKDELSYLPFALTSGENDSARILIDGKTIAPEEIGALVLKKLVEDASARLGEPVTEAVITVPAYFDDAQRQATKHAGELAGLNVLRILNEPTAAALAFSGGRGSSEKTLVLDLGGGTLDVTVLDAAGTICEVLSTAGDTHLGGDDFTKRLFTLVLSKCSADIQEIVEKSATHRQRLFEAAERLKCELSSVTVGSLELPFFLQTESGPKHLQLSIPRSEFEGACADLFDRCIEPFERAVRDAGLEISQITQVLLVGGASRMPRLRSLVKELSGGREPNTSLNPDESVAIGAALQSGILTGQVEEFVLLDVVPFSLGVETAGDKVEVVIPRNSSIPIRLSKMFSTAENFQRGADIIIVQGESRRASENHELGRFAIDGFKAGVKGAAQIEICFDIDENSILTVRAVDHDTSRESDLVIHGTTTLSKSELERLKGSMKRLKSLD